MPVDHALCHEHSGTPTQLSTGSNPCDHGIEETPSLVAAKNSNTAIALSALVPARHVIATGETRNLVCVHRSSSSDRLTVPLAIPLRV
jgi:hypothetical protein